MSRRFRKPQPPLSRLPVTLPPADDECGVGYAMRAAQANVMTLRRLLLWLDIDMTRLFTAAEIRRIAHVTGVSADWFSHQVPQHATQAGQPRWRFMGHWWSQFRLLRRSAIPVCPKCLGATEYCRGIWRLLLVPVCTRHRQMLVDHCDCCGKPISWRRPTVHVCLCGHPLRNPQNMGPVSDRLIDWSRWVEARMTGEAALAGEHGLPAWFDALSIDGASAVVSLVMGRGSQPSQTVAALLRVSEVAHRVDGALQALGTASYADVAAMTALAERADKSALVRLRVNGLVEADRNLARYWKRCLSEQIVAGASGGPPTTIEQLDLF